MHCGHADGTTNLDKAPNRPDNVEVPATTYNQMFDARTYDTMTSATNGTAADPVHDADGYSMPDQVPLASAQIAAEDAFALDARKVHVDKGAALGKGHYGVVFRGRLEGTARVAGTPRAAASPGETTRGRHVAVKMLPQDRVLAERERQDFWEEVKFLRHLQCLGKHANIVQFLGYVFGTAAEMMLVLEFAPNGSLLGYLRDLDRGVPLPELRAVTFAAEIAAGMAFIAEHRMVHRDLAARNVLLSTNLACKITDFGLARDVYDDNGLYQANVGYKQSNTTAWKWTALEALTKSKYTIEGDVWSFGVVLSEICSLGNNPYVFHLGLNEEFLQFLEDGDRMEKGRDWSPFLYQIMLRCWDGAPGQRPTFAQLVQELGAEAARLGPSTAPVRASATPTSGAGAEARDAQQQGRGQPISDPGYDMPDLRDANGRRLGVASQQPAAPTAQRLEHGTLQRPLPRAGYGVPVPAGQNGGAAGGDRLRLRGSTATVHVGYGVPVPATVRVGYGVPVPATARVGYGVPVPATARVGYGVPVPAATRVDYNVPVPLDQAAHDYESYAAPASRPVPVSDAGYEMPDQPDTQVDVDAVEGASASNTAAKQAKKPQRGKQRSMYLGFGDVGDGGGTDSETDI